MASRQSSRTKRGTSISHKQQRPRREPEERVLLIRDVPKFYEWQDVKDEIRVYAPHLTVHKYEGDEAIGMWEVNIRSNRAAHNAYTALTERGFRGGVQVGVSLTDKDGVIIEALRFSPPRPPPRPPVRTYAPRQEYAIPPPLHHLNYAGQMTYLPLPLNPYPPPHQHFIAPTNVTDLTRSMHSLDIGQHPPFRSLDQPQATTPARHRPTPSTDQPSATAPPSPKSRHSREDPLVVDGTIYRHSV